MLTVLHGFPRKVRDYFLTLFGSELVMLQKRVRLGVGRYLAGCGSNIDVVALGPGGQCWSGQTPPACLPASLPRSVDSATRPPHSHT